MSKESLDKIEQAFEAFKKILKDLSQQRKKALADFCRNLEKEKLAVLREQLKT